MDAGVGGRRAARICSDVPPAGAVLYSELHILHTLEPGQPVHQVLPVGRDDPAKLPPPGLRLDVVVRQLLPVDIHPSYDRHQGLLELRHIDVPTQQHCV
jgi:hypothetical protein